MTDRKKNPYAPNFFSGSNQAELEIPEPRRFGRRHQANMIDTLRARFSNPLYAGAALGVVAAIFAGIIFMSYPSSPTAPEDAPVILADSAATRMAPESPGGMMIAGAGNTMDSGVPAAALSEPAPAENLLAQQEPVNKIDDLARQAEAMFDETPGTAAAPPQAISEETPPPEKLASISDITASASPAPAAEKNASAVDITAPKAPPPEKLASAGSTPEAVEYLKSVLDAKDKKAAAETGAEAGTSAINTKAEKTAPAVTRIEPAAGAAIGMKSITPGNHFIQLGSVPEESRAASHWVSLRKTYPNALGSLPYRVQKAEIPGRGTFFRIQAGPMSKDSAKSICDSIKAQKPGACIVVQ